MSSIQQYINYRKSLAKYLEELRELINVPVTEVTLVPLDEVARIRKKLVEKITICPQKKFRIPFPEKTGQRFRTFIEQLEQLNSSPIYIWTEAANGCGLFQASSLIKINLDFSYDVNSQGIIVILTKDLRDRMIWDFFEENSEKIIEVELMGETWPQSRCYEI
ncbi:hypothetical protein [Ereboglobus sp. PH5-10]|uniref:hypothetical protein n=1 Tax=Ereboglobus sp. PH5-10 TaxID=2940629 RepID=UPI0024074B04|nr:hypothetical protein [Ereboglobus sp. PH5-10]